MNILRQVSLKKYNTFGIDVNAAAFAEFENAETLQQLISDPEFRQAPKLVLGGGSNILFTRDYEGLVLKNNIPGIEIISEDDDEVRIRAGAGENWHRLVAWSVEQGLGGIENLSLIPGNAGAAPIQNIGAYGVELKDNFHSLTAVDINTGEISVYDHQSCAFGYRDSIFKRSLKNKMIITGVELKLKKKPELKLSYGAIGQELKNMGVVNPDVKAVSIAVCNIRRSKLPDPQMIGNAGSFFKNPEISALAFEAIRKSFPDIVSYPAPAGNIKVAAGWLIEQCGWKGKIVGNTGAHKNQALVLVNYGKATGNEIWDLAMQIRQSVSQKFGIQIEPEVNII